MIALDYSLPKRRDVEIACALGKQRSKVRKYVLVRTESACWRLGLPKRSDTEIARALGKQRLKVRK